jgi:hypothetical protein
MPQNKNPEDYETMNPEKILRVAKRGTKYHCTACNSEIPFKQPCPTCNLTPDWDRIRIESDPL